MPIVKLFHGLAGPREMYPGGAEADFPEATAERLVRLGYGSAVGWKLPKSAASADKSAEKSPEK